MPRATGHQRVQEDCSGHPIGGQGGTGVEPELAEPQQADAEQHERQVVRVASATPGVFAIAAPTPSATANAPTRPMYIAVPIVVPSPVESDADSPSSAPMSRVVR